MNRAIRRVSIVAAVMFFALLLNASVGYLLRTGPLLNDPANRRVLDAEFDRPRGPMLVGTTPIVQSVPVSGARFSLERQYANGPLYAPVTGYYSYLYGRSGLEQLYNRQLTGTADSQVLSGLIDSISGKQPQGASLQLTINPKAQQAAWDALAGRPGAVVALDYTTGAVLAWVSIPSYDPNQLSSTNLASTQAAWDKLSADPTRPMSDRATKEVYPPGSTFKLVVGAAALENGMTPNSLLDAPSSLPLPQSNRTLPNAGPCGGDQVTMDQALVVSCNTAFANLGMSLGEDKLRQQAQKFGFDSAFGGDMASATSRFPGPMSQAELAMSSIGQFDVAASPLQMAMVAAAIANNGIEMNPYVVAQVRNPDLSVLQSQHPSQRATTMSPANAQLLQQMMVDVVARGTGQPAAIQGVRVGGKTGTAQSDPSRPNYSWFTGFADNPKVAVCAFLQDPTNPGTDTAAGTTATPIVRAVIEALR